MSLVAHRPSRATSPAKRYATSLEKAALLLQSLKDGRPLGATELAYRIGVDPSTAFRLAQALGHHGWVRQDPETKKYTLGIGLWDLGATALAGFDLRRAAREEMTRLAAVTGQSIYCSVLEGEHAVFIDMVKGSKAVRVFADNGLRAPAYAIAMGKALLAQLPETELVSHLPTHLRPFTARTVRTVEELSRQCAQIRHQGFAVNVGEWRPDAGGVAAPIFDSWGRPLAAISVDFPAVDANAGTVTSLAVAVSEGAARISRQLGSLPAPG
jgi:IclR family transcriptional regulator, KDG regulon repressor